MNIVIVGGNSFDTLEFHLKDELLHQGHKVKIIDLKPSFILKKLNNLLDLVSSNYVNKINKIVFNKILEINPDLVIVTYRHLHPETVRKIKLKKIKIIHINPDAITTFKNQQIFVEKYDAYFTKCEYIKRFMVNKLNLNTFIFNEAFNPRYHLVYDDEFLKMENQTKIDVLAYGNMYPYRNRILANLISSGLDVKLFGYKAKYFPNNIEDNFIKPIYGLEKSKLLFGSKIVFNNFHYAEIESVNNKFFEIYGSRSFQICDYKPILNKLLPIDPKIISFKNLDEAISKTRYFLNEPEHRYQIRRQLGDYFLDNFTYKHTIDKIFSKV